MTPQPRFHPTETAFPADDAERGDVPGWVLVTMMTAGLLVLLISGGRRLEHEAAWS